MASRVAIDSQEPSASLRTVIAVVSWGGRGAPCVVGSVLLAGGARLLLRLPAHHHGLPVVGGADGLTGHLLACHLRRVLGNLCSLDDVRGGAGRGGRCGAGDGALQRSATR